MKKSTWLALAITVFFSGAVMASSLSESAYGPESAAGVMNLDGALMTGGGAALPGVELGLAARLASPLYIGAEFGAFSEFSTPGYAMFPLLGTIYVQFEPDSMVRPLLGIMAGPVFSTGGGYSAASFGVFARPGLNVALGRTAALNLEARLGTIAGTFVFLPQIGAVFAL